MLELIGVSKRYGGLTVLDDVNLAVERHEVLGLIGPNGAGKTTLFSVASGFVRPDAGRVIVDSDDLTGKRPDRLSRAGLTRTFQIPQVFAGLTVEENVTIGALRWTRSTREAGAFARQSMELGRITHLADRPAGSLSVLEKKQVEIARALATKPSIVLFDEVMAGLRSGELSLVIDLVREAQREWSLTIVLVEHVIDAVWALAGRVAVLERGRLLTIGTPDQVRTDPAVIDAYLGQEGDDHA